MGNDGGTIAKRSEVVAVRNRNAEKTGDKWTTAAAAWTQCSLSKEQLQVPVVIDRLGRMYNKEALLQALLQKTDRSEIQHIKSMKDVRTLDLTLAVGGSQTTGTNFICPLNAKPMNGSIPFVVLPKSAKVYSFVGLQALGPLGTDPDSGDSFDPAEIQHINPPKEEQQRILELILSERADKKSKKRKTVEPTEASEKVESEAIHAARKAVLDLEKKMKPVHAQSAAVQSIYAGGE